MTNQQYGVEITLGDNTDREDAGAFVARALRMDAESLIRVRQQGEMLQLWATTPFDTLVTRSVTGTMTRADATFHAANLLPGLAVSRNAVVDPGPAVDPLWRTQLPARSGWVVVDSVPAAALAELNEQGGTAARDNVSPAGGTTTSLLDSEVLTVIGSGMRVVIPMRCVFALAGMGFAPNEPDEMVRVAATDAWLRIDARYGAVVRRRHSLLPLIF